MISRRAFVKGLVAAGAGLLVPSGLVTDAEEARRFWALDQTMARQTTYRLVAVCNMRLQWRVQLDEGWSPWIDLGSDWTMPVASGLHNVEVRPRYGDGDTDAPTLFVPGWH